MIRTIYFDFGNVVGFFDHGLAIRQFAQHTDLSPALLEELLYSGELADSFERGEISLEAFVAAALEIGQLRCSPRQFLAAYQDIFTPNPAICDLIPRLAGRVRLCLASNTNTAHALRFRQQFADVLGHFDALVLSHEIGARKPTASFFARAQPFAQAAPSECLFIDDLPANVAAAQAHGWQAIHYTPTLDVAEHLTRWGVL